MIGPFARRLIGIAETEEIGLVELKGFGEPLLAWRSSLSLRDGDGACRLSRRRSSAATSSSSCSRTHSAA